MKRLHSYRMRFVLIGFVATIVFSYGNVRADFIWAQTADMPTTRYGHSTSVVDGRIYAFGGLGALTRVDEYDPATDTWTRKADMPTASACLSLRGQLLRQISVFGSINEDFALIGEICSGNIFLFMPFFS